MRRTTSFSCIQITEESDEDNENKQQSIDIQNLDSHS